MGHTSFICAKAWVKRFGICGRPVVRDAAAAAAAGVAVACCAVRVALEYGRRCWCCSKGEDVAVVATAAASSGDCCWALVKSDVAADDATRDAIVTGNKVKGDLVRISAMDYTIIISSYEDYVLFLVPCFCVVVNKNSNMISFFI